MKDELIHFGISIKMDRSRWKINREHYAETNKKNYESAHFKRVENMMSEYLKSDNEKIKNIGKNFFKNIHNIFEDDTYQTYTDEYCLKHQQDCLYNYDLNMKYFDSIDMSKYSKIIEKTLKKFKKMRKVKDLNEMKKVSGVYIMELGEYKQLYVGQTNDIYRRIRGHWTAKKQFMKLIFMSKDESIISIDSFGPLDTTNIYVYEVADYYDMMEKEERIVSSIPSEYLLNRTRGGIRGFDEDSMVVDTIAHRNSRKLN